MTAPRYVCVRVWVDVCVSLCVVVCVWLLWSLLLSQPIRRSQGKPTSSATAPAIAGLSFRITAPHQEEEHTSDPNVLVLHGKHGMEAIHLFSGSEVCRMTLSGAGMCVSWFIVHQRWLCGLCGAHVQACIVACRYADVNGDGAVNHIQVIGARDGWAPIPSGLAFNPKLPGCLVKVSTGSPPKEQYFNGSLCHNGRGRSIGDELTKATVGFGSRSKLLRNIDVANVVAIPVVAPAVRRACAVCQV